MLGCTGMRGARSKTGTVCSKLRLVLYECPEPVMPGNARHCTSEQKEPFELHLNVQGGSCHHQAGLIRLTSTVPIGRSWQDA